MVLDVEEKGTPSDNVLEISGVGSNRLSEIWITEPGGEIGTVGEGGRKLALKSTEAEAVGSAKLPAEVEDAIVGGSAPGGVEVSEQMVVVTLTTVVDV